MPKVALLYLLGYKWPTICPPHLLLLATYLVIAMEWPLLSYFHTNLLLGNPARSWAENMKHQSARCSVLNFSLLSASSLYYKPSKVLLAARLPKYLWLWHHIPPIIHVSLTKPSETWYNFSCSIFPSTSFFHCETDNKWNDVSKVRITKPRKEILIKCWDRSVSFLHICLSFWYESSDRKASSRLCFWMNITPSFQIGRMAEV